MFKLKIDLPQFDRELEIEDFLDWLKRGLRRITLIMPRLQRNKELSLCLTRFMGVPLRGGIKSISIESEEEREKSKLG